MNPNEEMSRPKKIEFALNVSFKLSLMVSGIKGLFKELAEKFKRMIMAILPY
jgi:hypothetical protein